MKNFQSIIVILFVSVCTHLVESQDCSMHKVLITCKYIEKQPLLDENEFIASCIGDDSINVTFPGSSVSTVLHSNGSEVTNLAEIEGFLIQYATVKFIPTGIASKLPNLKLLAISRCYLVSLSKEDLREFDKLEFADFSRNKISSIDADLFEYNKNLKIISLEMNPIRYIHPEFFTNLKNLNLEMFRFESSGCMAEEQIFNIKEGHDIATFEWNYENCTDFSATFETQNRIKASLCDEAKTSSSTSKITEKNDENTAMLASKLETIGESINYLSETLSARISALEELVKRIEKRLEQ